MDKKEILYSDFNSVENILGAVMKNPKLKQGLKNATIFKFWPKVAGKKFEKYSKANGLTQTPEGHVLTVACANAAVSSRFSSKRLSVPSPKIIRTASIANSWNTSLNIYCLNVSSLFEYIQSIGTRATAA